MFFFKVFSMLIGSSSTLYNYYELNNQVSPLVTAQVSLKQVFP